MAKISSFSKVIERNCTKQISDFSLNIFRIVGRYGWARWVGRAGCKRISSEKASGVMTKRPELTTCFKALNAGDVLTVWTPDRLGRSPREVIGLLDDLKARGIACQSLTEPTDMAPSPGRAIGQMV